MTTPTAMRTTTDAGTPRSNPARIYGTEARHEFLKLIRIPIFAVSTIALPVMFYVLFGVAFAGGAGRWGRGDHLHAGDLRHLRGHRRGPVRLRRLGRRRTRAGLDATQARLADAAAGLLRGEGRDEPRPSRALIIGALFVLGATLGGVRMPATQWVSLGLVLLLGALPFSAMGLAFGYLVGPNSAPAVLNLVWLPMAFASGLWIPIHQLPAFVQGIAPALPPYHFAQLALGTVGAAEGGSQALHAVVLLAFTAFFLAVAAWGFRRDEGRTYG